MEARSDPSNHWKPTFAKSCQNLQRTSNWTLKSKITPRWESSIKRCYNQYLVIDLKVPSIQLQSFWCMVMTRFVLMNFHFDFYLKKVMRVSTISGKWEVTIVGIFRMWTGLNFQRPCIGYSGDNWSTLKIVLNSTFSNHWFVEIAQSFTKLTFSPKVQNNFLSLIFLNNKLFHCLFLL